MSPKRTKINKDLDQKTAKTVIISSKAADDRTQAEVEILTGRYHQIRRHFDMIGHPIMGDPKYGRGNKNRDGLKLIGHRLQINLARKLHNIELDDDLLF